MSLDPATAKPGDGQLGLPLERQITLMGIPIACLTENEVVRIVFHELERGRGGRIMTVGLDPLRQCWRSSSVRELLDQADLVVADGMPLVWSSRLKGTPLPERVAGSDLIWSLSAEAAKRGRSIYLLGGNPGVAEVAASRFKTVYPGLEITGLFSPPYGFDRDPVQVEQVVSRVRAAEPDLVFVGLTFSKQERLIARLRAERPESWFIGVGISISFVAGDVRRAPLWMQRAGLEWVHRLLQEPRRLGRRYLIDDLPFAGRLFGHSVRERFSPSGDGLATRPDGRA